MIQTREVTILAETLDRSDLRNGLSGILLDTSCMFVLPLDTTQYHDFFRHKEKYYEWFNLSVWLPEMY